MIAIAVDRESSTPLYRQIVRQVQAAVEAGVLGGQERLPTTRELARTLGVNRLTVTRAYGELARAGWIDSHVGRGSFVGPAAPEKNGPRGASRSGSLADSVPWSSLFARRTGRAVEMTGPTPSSRDRKGIVSFASLFPDPALFPVDAFRRAMDDVLRREGNRILGYGPPGGHPPLREMIAEQLRSRGMDVTAENIVITSGSQQGIDLVARALLDPDDTVLVENPTYTGAVQVFSSYGGELAGVPLDAEGVMVPLLAQAVARRRPKLIYVMPNFQNPTSETMSLVRRRALVDLAVSSRLPLLEDDFGGDLRFEGAGLPALKALPGGSGVIYISTFAKKLLPGLRIGWLAAPLEMAERLTRLKKITDYSTSLLSQAALHEFCRRGDMERHLAVVIQHYRERRDAMLSAMRRCFPAEASWTRPQGGLVIWVTLPEGVDGDLVAAEAEQRGVLVGRGDLFYLDSGAGHNLRLTYSQAGPREIHRGIRILGDVIHKSIRARRPGARGRGGESLPLI